MIFLNVQTPIIQSRNNWQKLMGEYSKFNYHSYDILLVKIELNILAENNHKVWQFSVPCLKISGKLRKVLKFLGCASNTDVWFVKKKHGYYY